MAPRIRSTLRRWFLLIQEPRVVRIGMLVVYLWTIYGGIIAYTQSPDKFFDVTGPRIVYSIAGFLILGGILGTIAILPGIWWLERMAIVSIAGGLAARAVLIFALAGSSEASTLLALTFLLFVVRWVSIRRADLAPIAG